MGLCPSPYHSTTRAARVIGKEEEENGGIQGVIKRWVGSFLGGDFEGSPIGRLLYQMMRPFLNMKQVAAMTRY